jgi:hypothetical protein
MMLDADLARKKSQELGINVSQLSALSGIPPSKLSLFLGGTCGIRNHEITTLRSTLDDVEQLIEVAKPFPLSFKKTEVIRDLIQKMKNNELPRRQP